MRAHILLALLLTACGGDVTRRDLLFSGPAGPPDALDRLAARLPGGADRCTGVRVGAVPAERRLGVRRMSALGNTAAVAWGPEAPLAAYVEARQEDALHGRRSVFGLARVSSVERFRAYLEAQRELRIRWTDAVDGCPGPACCPGPECWQLRAEPVDEHTVRIRRGPWQDAGLGVEVRCVELARRFPEALEVASWTAGDGLFSGGGDWGAGGALGFDVAALLEPHGSGVRRVEQYRLPNADLADEIALLLQQVREGNDDIGAIAEQSKVVQGDLLEIRTDVRWEDLELLAGDEARAREAVALEAAASRPLPVDEIDYLNLAMVREQVSLRSESLADASGPQRRAQVAELRVVLERGAEKHPGHDAFVEALLELLLGELRDPEAAVRWTEEVLARGPHDRRAWQVRRRRALARVGVDGLAEALEQDGVVDRPARARAAAEVLAGAGPGVDYEVAEGAWLASEALARTAPRLARARGRLRLESLLEALLTLADGAEHGRSVHVRVESAMPEPLGAAGAAFQWQEGRRLVRAGSASTDAPDGAQRLLHDAGAGLEGPTRVVLALTTIGGDLRAPEAVLALEGEADGRVLTLTRASALVEGRDRTPIRWERVGALVADPMAGYEMRLFPPPNLSVDFADAPEADAARERVEDEDSLSCIRLLRREATLRCNASPQRDSTRRAWRRLVGPLVLR
ncbi:MAG: hypothetical protein CMN30_27905 [Sandaracinus sp.]|nr:hypothetical protein [Sandaracinus sp.]